MAGVYVLGLMNETLNDGMRVFIDDLMSRMTLEEKLGQMNLLSIGYDKTGPVLSEDAEGKIRKGLVGTIINIFEPKSLRRFQELAVSGSRLGIPMLFSLDVIHGLRTTFPIPLAQSASWDLDLIERCARAAADEAAASGLHWTFSPMVDISRDPRWGRVCEGGGEDPFLGSLTARAMVKGYQQDDLSREDSIMSCIKHFALYGATEAGRDYNIVDMSRQRMFNEYLAPYRAGIEAGAASVMTAFNEVEGLPATGNKWLLADLLREQWGFGGVIVTDYVTICEMTVHGVGDKARVTELAFNAGVDVDMVSEHFVSEGKKLVREKRVPVAVVDAACRRVLEAKYKLGLFKNPYKNLDANDAQRARIMSPEKIALSREAAAKSVVLLKNDNQLLPLTAERKIAFVGPQVKRINDLVGPWSAGGKKEECVTLWSALERRFGAGKFSYALGCNLVEDRVMLGKFFVSDAFEPDPRSAQELLDEAVQVARDADVVVAVLGESFRMSGENNCRVDIGLPRQQVELLKALKATGKPVVLVLMNGRPLTLTWEDENIDAILETWFLGTQSGEAMTDVLFGDVNPSGKLTMTFPRHVGQVPIYYNHKRGGRPFDPNPNNWFTSKYLDESNDPLYPFGYGLSYTRFDYGDVSLDKNTLTKEGTLTAAITITNSGKFDGTETVQLYIRDLVGSITRPMKELKGFQQIRLRAGESRTVRFTISAELLKFYNADLQYVAEPGEFDLFIGPNSRDAKPVRFALSAQ